MSLRLSKTMWAAGLVAGLASCAAVLGNANAQESSEAERARQKIVANTNLVVLPVTVKDARGNLVAGLTAGDFRIYDDEEEQTISVFDAEGQPLSLVVLIDDDLRADDAREMAPSLRAILAGLSVSDEARICRFDLEFYAGEEFTGNDQRLLAELKDAQEASKERPPVFVPWKISPSTHTRSPGEPAIVPPGDPGGRPTKALEDAVYAAAELLKERGRERRKIMLIVSDGINGPEFNKHKYEETVSELLAGNVSVFSVAVGRTSFHKQFARLRDYANESGGDIYYGRKGAEMEQLYSRITEEARHEYVLAYEPRGNDPGAKYHQVKVSVMRKGMTVKTREGYYAVNAVR
jgi:VWFA-related protein